MPPGWTKPTPILLKNISLLLMVKKVYELLGKENPISGWIFY